MPNIAVRDQAITRPLKVLVPLIKDEIARGDDAGLEHYRRAGEMLIEAKEQVGHGEWVPWLARNFTLSPTTARRYITLAERMLSEKGRARSFTTLSEATTPSRAPDHRPTWHAPVQEITNRVNVEALAAQERSREKERRVTHNLALQLIDIGYKVLATKLHPDKGGSAEAMARLNRVRDLLRRAI